MVNVVQIRGIDIKPGDIVQARPDELLGWFLVSKVASLPNGMITVTDADEVNGFLIAPLDILGLQIMSPLPGASHPPAPGSGPASAADQYSDEQDAAAAAAKAEADAEAIQAAEEAAASGVEDEPEAAKSGLFG